MRRLTPSTLKDLLSASLLTVGFTLISSGIGIICGSGAGLIAGGIGVVVVQQWWTKTG
jgi:purine nucleoside phosphorylase